MKCTMHLAQAYSNLTLGLAASRVDKVLRGNVIIIVAVNPEVNEEATFKMKDKEDIFIYVSGKQAWRNYSKC